MWIMALSGFGVPFGFRAVFAEINSPMAVGYYLQTGLNPGWMPYANPLFWTLYLHTVAAVISVGGFVAAIGCILPHVYQLIAMAGILIIMEAARHRPPRRFV